MFVHNGQIAEFGLLRQALMARVEPKYFDNILGSTDSELMFHLALSFGLKKDVPAAIAEMVRVVEATGKENGVAESLRMTLGISDGKGFWGFRYGSNGIGPTLYTSPDLAELRRLNPDLKGKFGDFAVCVVSEPIGDYQDSWQAIPENSKIIISNKHIEVSEFKP